MVKGKPYSFLHVDKAEIDLPPDVNLYAPEVYLKAKENLEKTCGQWYLRRRRAAVFLYLPPIMNGRSQTGLVGCASIDDYLNNIIKKHELTRADKEADRTNHVDYWRRQHRPYFSDYREDKVCRPW